MEKKETDKNAPIFDFYKKIKEIITEYESDLDKLDSKYNDQPNANEDIELKNIVSNT